MNNKNKSLIEIKNLEFKYHKKTILEINNLTINQNTTTVILGPSGSGKSTLLDLISGFNKATKGKIKILNNPKIYEIGYIMQSNNVYPNISVLKNVYLSAKNYPQWVKSNLVDEMKLLSNSFNNSKKQNLDFLIEKYYKDSKLSFWYLLLFKLKIFFYSKNLKKAYQNLKRLLFKNIFYKKWKEVAQKLDILSLEKQKASNLSGGQKQRVAFAKAIIKKHKFIILDEPFSALDAKIKESTINWILDLKKEFNLSLIVVTHDQQDAMKLGDKIILINEGRIIQHSSPQELYEKPLNLFAAKFIGYPEINLIKQDQNYSYYIRHNKIKIDEKSLKPNAIVVNKKHLGENINYTLEFNNFKINLLSKNNYEISSKLHISFDDKDILKYNQKGELVS
ncbi:ABC transporter ATP-binding protein [Mycoplasmopsis synoviae]|uniref:ABC transporter ATP-binding protein n=1 Tax=Mycoplasmopsis synoviae TaxID=2109 RepID=UPI001C563005|nr:ABC transporter ATP-binding protein [Mycoplasmopsis synoviae]QXV99203.1 ABC transporter ATP-binding protein [Mycoplasmopsis synoviae]UBM43378.1 ABC transporter ATP-binding protein [Mycoplasmopsis synoviae]UZW63494.1 ABC transporter ATP-binding protein [Mycoplasmopsis synoviae]